MRLYGETPEKMAILPSNIFHRLRGTDIELLGKPVTNEEIKRALFDMDLLKAPGSDGFQAIFFQSQWDTMGSSMCEWVQGIFAGKYIDLELNNSLLVLIPKNNNLVDFNHFRLISLCSVMYKLVMKVIANSF